MNYLITFQGKAAGTRDLVATAIKGLGEWGELTPTSYLLETDREVPNLIEHLQPLLGPSDQLWLFTVAGPWAGYGDPIVEDHAVALLGDFQDWIPKDWDESKGGRG